MEPSEHIIAISPYTFQQFEDVCDELNRDPEQAILELIYWAISNPEQMDYILE